MTIPLLNKETHWGCPNCNITDMTQETAPHTRMHTCKSNGLTMPMIEAGTKAKVELVVRGDYVMGEIVTTDQNGRPIQSVITTREDGQDCAVFAATARGKLRED